MQFCFYPQHEHGCPHVSHCPHLGGAAVGTLVLNANTSGDTIAGLHRSLDAERKRNAKLVEENLQLEEALKQAQLELKLERQNKFATNQQKQAGDSAENKAAEESATHEPKKRGAPVGHPGWFRPTPTHYDWDVDVPAPSRCPHCQGHVTVCEASDPDEHLQEDILDGVYRVVLHRHPVASCDDCGAWVQQPGEGEILGSRIGPHLRSKAIFLRNLIGISYRRPTPSRRCPPRVIDEMFGITFTPAALIGLETVLADKAGPVVDDIAKKLASSEGAVHADETYWTTARRREGKLSRKKQAAEKAWLREELLRLETCDVSHEKAITLQARLLTHHGEWLVFLDDPRVPPTNNLAERALRPLVVLRKITFGSRSDAGATRMAKIMTVGETARRHGHRASQIYFELYTRPPTGVLRRLYAGGKQAAA